MPDGPAQKRRRSPTFYGFTKHLLDGPKIRYEVAIWTNARGGEGAVRGAGRS